MSGNYSAITKKKKGTNTTHSNTTIQSNPHPPFTMVAFAKFLLACLSIAPYVSAIPLHLTKRLTRGVQTNCKAGHFALTFDDGPYKYSHNLVEHLNKRGIKV
jgi:peptidoglycan/xylan/chitin deacetylase (PgdA/CDA1 family)